MKFKTLFLLLMISLSVNTIHAQQDTSKPSADTIQYFKGRERFYLSNKKLTITELKPMLNTYNSSAIELREYRKRATPGTIALLTGITAGVLAFTKLNKDTHFFTPYTITLFAGDLIGIPLMISANKYLKKSVRLYNQEVLR
jgi:hypothetical protein